MMFSEESIHDEVLSSFNEESVIVENYYKDIIKVNMDENPAYSQYKDYDVLYQQNTGINTISSLYFNFMINDKLITNVKVGEEKEIEGGYKLTVAIENNPANDILFIKEPKDFTILSKIILTNKFGESVTINKSLKANVVKVVGKIINRKAKYEFEKCLEIQDVMEYLMGIHKSLKVQLFDGSIIDVIGCVGQGGGTGGPTGSFAASLLGTYDLKFLLEGATSAECVDTYMSGYLIDKDNNLVDPYGNIVVPYKNRESKSFTSNINEIKLNAKVGTIPDGSVLESKKRTDLNLDSQYVAYDLNVVCNGESIQPIGYVDLTINIPNNLINKNLGVYYMDENGKLEELNSTVNGNVVSFTTTHFSTYVVMEKVVEPTKPIDPVKPNENVKSTENTSPKTSVDSVNTGDTTMTTLYIALLVVSVGILLVLKKKSALK